MAYNYEYPYNGTERYNNDWMINKVKELAEEWTKVESDWKDVKEYIDNYFSNLDVYEEISEKLDAMYADGTFNSIVMPILLEHLPPLIVDSVDAMVDKYRLYILKTNGHVYQYTTTWIDTGFIFGEEIGNVVTYTGQIPSNADWNDLRIPNTIMFGSSPNSWINSPITSAGVLYIDGISQNLMTQRFIAFGTGIEWYRSYQSTRDPQWSAWVCNSVRYTGSIPNNADWNNLNQLHTVMFGSSPNNWTNAPVTTAGLLYIEGYSQDVFSQIFTSYYNGITWYRYYREGTWSDWQSLTVHYNGRLPYVANWNNFNEIHTIMFASLPNEWTNAPSRNAGILWIEGDSTNVFMQMFIEFNSGKRWSRSFQSTRTPQWSEWVSSGNDASGNNYAHMYSIGNSILTGSVWKSDGSVTLSSYGNAPYSVIANAIDIPESNVTHRLISSTGLIYNAGSGSFLTNIKQMSLAPYDVLLTHLWIRDLDTPLGTVNDSSTDETICGAVVDLIEYMKTNNGMCQLILVSVPPVDSNLNGEEVFTHVYSGGSSIAELDVAMHQLALKYRFTYIDWQELNLSYYYHDYTDDVGGNKLHANNQDTYRIMGAYLGGRASEQLNF